MQNFLLCIASLFSYLPMLPCVFVYFFVFQFPLQAFSFASRCFLDKTVLSHWWHIWSLEWTIQPHLLHPQVFVFRSVSHFLHFDEWTQKLRILCFSLTFLPYVKKMNVAIRTISTLIRQSTWIFSLNTWYLQCSVRICCNKKLWTHFSFFLDHFMHVYSSGCW